MPAKINFTFPGSDLTIKVEPNRPPILYYIEAYNRDVYARLSKSPQCPSRAWFFHNIVTMLWGEAKPPARWEWNPWAEKFTEKVHEYDYLGVVGCANSSKTSLASLYGLVNWIADPVNTMVLVTSTSLGDSRKRIWGAIRRYYDALGDAFWPGKLVDSRGTIRTRDGNGNLIDTAGITLIAGEKKKERESIGKLIGIKAKYRILIGDELPELSEALYAAVESNLMVGGGTQMIGLGNFYSWFDPCGTFIRPKGGINAISPNDTEWETEIGYCIRFDGAKSPNLLEGVDRYPGIYGSKDWAQHQKHGVNTVNYWRMCRSFPPPIGQDNIIYSEADMIAGNFFASVEWREPPIPLAAMDPSFTSGGDRSMAMLGLWGTCIDGQKRLALVETVHLVEDATIRNQPRSQQIAQKFIDFCIKRGVKPEHAGLDATGAGKVLHDIIVEKWSQRVLAVQFGGAASELPATLSGNIIGKDAYANRVTELWYVGKEFMNAGQLRGGTTSLANEMKARTYVLVKGTAARVRVEPKSDMKERLGFSPDEADAFMILIDVARTRLGAVPGTATGFRQKSQVAWKQKARQLDQLHSQLYQEV